jgi:DNA primase
MFRNPEIEEIRTLLRMAGIHYKNGIRYFQVKCPYHDDHTPSAVIYKDNGFFHCYTCLTDKPFPRLYKDLAGIEWDGKFNLSLTMFRDVEHRIIAERVKNERRLWQRPLDGIVNFDMPLKNVQDVPQAWTYCNSRAVSPDFIEAFGIKVFESGRVNDIPWHNRLITPLKDGEGVLRSVEGRDYTRQQQKKVLYPLNTSVSFIFNSICLDVEKTLIVVEGLMDVHKIWQRITQNITCTFGIQLKEPQKEQLRNFKDIILFIDDDVAGRQSVDQFEKFYPWDFRVAISPGKDPGDSTFRELETAIEGAKPFNVFLMEDAGLFPEHKKPTLSFRRKERN